MTIIILKIGGFQRDFAPEGKKRTLPTEQGRVLDLFTKVLYSGFVPRWCKKIAGGLSFRRTAPGRLFGAVFVD